MLIGVLFYGKRMQNFYSINIIDLYKIILNILMLEYTFIWFVIHSVYGDIRGRFDYIIIIIVYV